MFKNRLDKFLHDHDIYYNWEADLTGTADRSKSDLNVNSISVNLVIVLRCGDRGFGLHRAYFRPIFGGKQTFPPKISESPNNFLNKSLVI